jgi:hypothetical protein
MSDISVQEIIATFKGIERKSILSTAQTDDFLTIIKKKNHWTIEEFKEFSFIYSLEYMNSPIMDMMVISKVVKKYNFKLNWSDYFNVIDSIKSIHKQKKYINYYFWYHTDDMNEEVYNQLLTKPYFKFLKSSSKSQFLQHCLKTDNRSAWINKYFTEKEIKKGLTIMSMHIDRNSNDDNEKVKEFYHTYENLMPHKIKLKFFNQVIQTGSLSLIKYFYIDKGIRNLNKLVLLWHVCADTAANNTLEILNCLKEYGVRFTVKDLEKSKNHTQWDYMEHKEELLHFFKLIEIEKNYNQLDKKLKNKNVKTKRIKL